jgi:hypothetical protein
VIAEAARGASIVISIFIIVLSRKWVAAGWRRPGSCSSFIFQEAPVLPPHHFILGTGRPVVAARRNERVAAARASGCPDVCREELFGGCDSVPTLTTCIR